jgi:uracil phosphoribosyltransferase
MVIELGKEHSILSEFLRELRDKEVQQDPMRFRRNLERIGEIFAYEISKKLAWKTVDTITPLGTAPASTLVEQPVVATILRAGLPLHQGVLNYFDRAENAFISAYRKHHTDGTFNIQLEYVASPDLNGKTLILCDPMLATGQSLVLTFRNLMHLGRPKHTHIINVIASTGGVEYAKKHLPDNTTLWIAAIDEELTSQSYIVPGLGDAGDLAYGVKL